MPRAGWCGGQRDGGAVPLVGVKCVVRHCGCMGSSSTTPRSLLKARGVLALQADILDSLFFVHTAASGVCGSPAAMFACFVGWRLLLLNANPKCTRLYLNRWHSLSLWGRHVRAVTVLWAHLVVLRMGCGADMVD